MEFVFLHYAFEGAVASLVAAITSAKCQSIFIAAVICLVRGSLSRNITKPFVYVVEWGHIVLGENRRVLSIPEAKRGTRIAHGSGVFQTENLPQ